MIAREAVLNDPRVIELLKTSFVCVGVDNVANPNITAAERQFLSDKGGRASTEGMSVFTAGGKLLGSGGGFQAEPNLRMLKAALARYEPEENVAIESPVTDEDRRKIPEPPEGGLVLDVTWKLLETKNLAGNSTSAGGKYVDCFADSLGVDRLWIRKDEVEALAAGRFPESLERRIAKFHFDYVLCGKTKEVDLKLEKGRVSGTLLSQQGDPGELLGFIETTKGRVTRFDMVVKGLGTHVGDCGFSAGLTVVAKGEKVPIALRFSLADPEKDTYRVLPAKIRAHDYLR